MSDHRAVWALQASALLPGYKKMADDCQVTGGGQVGVTGPQMALGLSSPPVLNVKAQSLCLGLPTRASAPTPSG